MILQMQSYQLFDDSSDAFIARFRDHAQHILARLGFVIVSGWVTRRDGHPEFVYLLEWESEQAMSDGWAAFWADAEWHQLKERTTSENGGRDLVGEVQDRILTPVEFLPSLVS